MNFFFGFKKIMTIILLLGTITASNVVANEGFDALVFSFSKVDEIQLNIYRDEIYSSIFQDNSVESLKLKLILLGKYRDDAVIQHLWQVVKDLSGDIAAEAIMQLFIEHPPNVSERFYSLLRCRFGEIAGISQIKSVLDVYLDSKGGIQKSFAYGLLEKVNHREVSELYKEAYYKTDNNAKDIFHLIALQNNREGYSTAISIIGTVEDDKRFSDDIFRFSIINKMIMFNSSEIKTRLLEDVYTNNYWQKIGVINSLGNYSGNDVIEVLETLKLHHLKRNASTRDNIILQYINKSLEYSKRENNKKLERIQRQSSSSTPSYQLRSNKDSTLDELANQYKPVIRLSSAGSNGSDGSGVNLYEKDVYEYDDYIPMSVYELNNNDERKPKLVCGDSKSDLNVDVLYNNISTCYIDFSPMWSEWTVTVASGYKKLWTLPTPEPTVYYYAWHNPNKVFPYAVQYWFFYFYNDWLIFDHPGDWETITIFFDYDKEPVEGLYSTHYEARKQYYSLLVKDENQNHPHVFVSNGGHGSYVKADDTVYKDKESGLYNTDNHYGNKQQIEPESYILTNLVNETWIIFGGRWGDENSAPRGPKFRTDTPKKEDDPYYYWNKALKPPLSPICLKRLETKIFGEDGPWDWANGYFTEGTTCIERPVLSTPKDKTSSLSQTSFQWKHWVTANCFNLKVFDSNGIQNIDNFFTSIGSESSTNPDIATKEEILTLPPGEYAWAIMALNSKTCDSRSLAVSESAWTDLQKFEIPKDNIISNFDTKFEDKKVVLNWKKPELYKEFNTLIVRSESIINWSPESQKEYNDEIFSGLNVVYNSNGTSYVDSSPEQDTIYYYKAFIYDKTLKSYSEGVSASIYIPTSTIISGFVTDSSDTGLSNITMNLSGTSTATTKTDQNGKYSFEKLPKGYYTVSVANETKCYPDDRKIELVSGSAIVSDVNFTTDKTKPFVKLIFPRSGDKLKGDFGLFGSVFKQPDCKNIKNLVIYAGNNKYYGSLFSEANGQFSLSQVIWRDNVGKPIDITWDSFINSDQPVTVQVEATNLDNKKGYSEKITISKAITNASVSITPNDFNLPIPASKDINRSFSFNTQNTSVHSNSVWFTVKMEHPEAFPDRGEYDHRESTSSIITQIYPVGDVYPLGIAVLDSDGNTLIDIEQIMAYHSAKYGDPESNGSGAMLAAFGVNVVNGNFYYETNDMSLEGIGLPFVFGRSYNSIGYNNWSPIFGHGGWTHSYDYKIFLNESGRRLYLTMPDGHNERYAYVDGKWQTMVPGSFWVIKENITDNESTYSAWDKTNTRYDFSRNYNNFWYLSEISDTNNNKLKFEYEEERIKKVTDTRGREIIFTYNDLLTKVEDGTGRSISFQYEANYLTGYSDAEKKLYEYEYDDNKILTKIKDPRKNDVLINTYGKDGNVLTQTDGLKNIWKIVYTDTLTTVTNPLNQSVKYTIDASLRMITQVEDHFGNKNTFAYNDTINEIQEISLIKNAISPRHYNTNKMTEYTYSGNATGNPIEIKNPDQAVTSIHWNEDREYKNKNLIKTITPPGVTKPFELYYDSNDNIDELKKPLGAPLKFTYTSKGQIETVTDEFNNTTIYSYENDYLKKIIDPMDYFIEYFYDDKGRVKSVKDKRGFLTTYEYDNNDKVKKITDPYEKTIVYEYDDSGNLILLKDKRGNYTRYTYYESNLIETKIQMIKNENEELNYTTKIEYDGLQRIKKVTNAKEQFVENQYDLTGNIDRIINSLNQYIDYTYDANGNVIKTEFKDEKGAVLKTILTEYDDADRVRFQKVKLGDTYLITQYTYNAKGLVETITDPKNQKTKYEYDDLGRIIKIIDLNKKITSVIYDDSHNLKTIIDPEQRKTVFKYDSRKQLEYKQDHENNVWRYEYDGNGNLKYYTAPTGQVTTYEYDNINRIVKILYPDKSEVKFTEYDANGNIKTMIDNTGKTSYEYDDLNRLISRKDCYDKTVKYLYDSIGNIKKITYPNDKAVSYEYNEINQMKKITDWLNNSTSYTYNALGKILSVVNGNGTKVSMNYDTAGRLSNYATITAANDVISGYKFTYDDNGNRKAVDFIEPLLPTIEQKSEIFIPNSLNQLKSKTSSEKVTYEYDKKGNLIKEIGIETTKTLGYDDNDYLTSWNDGTNNYSYIYSGTRDRIATVKDGKETRYILDINNALPEVICRTDSEGTDNDYFIYGANGLVSLIKSDDTVLYYHFDATGNTVAMTDKDQKVVNKYSYTPFGHVTKFETDNINPFQYSGQYGVMAEDNGLYFMRAIFYNPDMRRFISLDKQWGNATNPQSLNLYAYVQGNPLMKVDPSGMVPEYIKRHKQLRAIKRHKQLRAIKRHKQDRLEKKLKQDVIKTVLLGQTPALTAISAIGAYKVSPVVLDSIRKAKPFVKSIIGKAGKFLGPIAGSGFLAYRAYNGEIEDLKGYFAEVGYYSAGISLGAGAAPKYGPFTLLLTIDLSILSSHYATGGRISKDWHKKLIRAAASREAADQIAEKGLKHIKSAGASERCIYDPKSCGMDWYGGFVLSIGSVLELKEW